MGREATSGDTVRVHFTGKLEDGTVFDTSREGEPLQFEIGADEVIGGFERAVEGMEVGENREAELQPDEAYGERDEELVFPVPRNQLPEGFDPEVGDEVAVEIEDGREVPGRVAEVDDDSVTLDLNHPLAGRPLTFEIELVDVQD